MADPYRLSPAPESTRPGERPVEQGLLRPALWLLLIVSAVANGVSTSIDLHPLVGIGFGLLTVACIVALVVHHYRHQRR